MRQIEQVCSCVVVVSVTTAGKDITDMTTTERNIPAVFNIFRSEKGGNSNVTEVVTHTGDGGHWDDRSGEERNMRGSKLRRGKSERKVKGEGNYNKTLTQRDVRQLERHLSMKRTIRKKIMRDLQQASVEGEEKDEIGFKSLKDDEDSEPNVLDRLREEKSCSRQGTLVRYYDII